MTPSRVTAETRASVDPTLPEVDAPAVTSEGVVMQRIRPLSREDIFTIHELSEYVPYSYASLLAASRLREHPLPTILRGKRLTVIYGDFLDWLRDMYGVDGIMRGREVLELLK